MYICNLCGGEFPYLVFEYNMIVCEGCSIHKNISNCRDFPEDSLEIEEEEEEFEEVESDDVQQLYDLIEKIDHPRIREDFRDLVEQYIQGF